MPTLPAALADRTERWFGVVLGSALAMLFYWWPAGAVIVFPAAVLAPST